MRPCDIEALVCEALTLSGMTAHPVPLPQGFADMLPSVLVTRTGGSTRHAGADVHMASVDAYASTWGEANAVASEAVSAIRNINGSMVAGVQVYDVDCDMPYTNPDPNHADIARCTFVATVACSGKE